MILTVLDQRVLFFLRGKFCIFTAHGVGNILPNFRKPMKMAGA